MPAIQTALDEALPLSEVTFCVVDLETTGGSPTACAITEVGAVKYRGGERVGAFHSLVNPSTPIPRFITHLTGIDDGLVEAAPPIEAVVPALAEFLSGGVFVAHNARFDHGFLNAALIRLDYEPIPPPPVCTARLARRVVWPDVPNVRLDTLARYFRCAVRPNHRALPDAEACAEVLHGLLDLGGCLGILTLGDLHDAVRARGAPHFAKIRLADHLPHSPGVYLFRSGDGRVLYVGKARDLRSRVKSYFYGDDRKKVQDLLAEAARVEGRPCRSELEALVMEARLIRSAGQAERAREALEEAFPLRRCTRRMGIRTRFAPCILAGLGRCTAPCDGGIDPERYGELVRSLISSSPHREAALLRDRMRALAEALVRARADAWLAGSGELVLRDGDGNPIRLEGGALATEGGALSTDDRPPPIETPCPPERADELAAVRRFLAAHPVTVVHAERPPAEPIDGGAALHGFLRRLRAADRLPVDLPGEQVRG